MTDQWTAVKAPFADPSNPDIGVKTPLWDGAPRPQNEVGGEPRVGMASKDAVLRTVSDAQDALASEINKMLLSRANDPGHQYDFTKANWSAAPSRFARFREWVGDRLFDLAGWIEELAMRVQGW